MQWIQNVRLNYDNLLKSKNRGEEIFFGCPEGGGYFFSSPCTRMLFVGSFLPPALLAHTYLCTYDWHRFSQSRIVRFDWFISISARVCLQTFRPISELWPCHNQLKLNIALIGRISWRDTPGGAHIGRLRAITLRVCQWWGAHNLGWSTYFSMHLGLQEW